MWQELRTNKSRPQWGKEYKPSERARARNRIAPVSSKLRRFAPVCASSIFIRGGQHEMVVELLSCFMLLACHLNPTSSK